MTTRGTVVLVDVYAPTRRLAPEFRRAGFDCVRVQSTREIPAVYRSGGYPREDFVADLVDDGDLESLVARVRPYRPVAVMTAGESGVELADRLSARLGTPSNGTDLSSARRDKFLMIEALREAGLRATQQVLVEDEVQLRSWHEAMGGRVVLKPRRSAASVGVTFCDDPDSSVAAFRKLHGRESVFSEAYSGVVAQEYLVGAEYMVNTASREGRHRVCDIWRTTHVQLNGVPDLLDGMFLVPAVGAVQDALTQYCCEVLDALGIRYGLAHLEVKMTPSGPCLVELGARMAGADLPYYTQLATGQSQLTWAVDAYVRPEAFDSRWNKPYELQQYFASLPMLSPVEGILDSYRRVDAIRSLESFRDFLVAVPPGGRLQRTVDDSTIPAAVNLMHPVAEAVKRDARTVRYFDGDSFYVLASEV